MGPAAIAKPTGASPCCSRVLTGESFELVAYDWIGLASQTMTLGPLVGDEGRVANLGFGVELVAVQAAKFRGL